jgi:UPF0755 protein
MSEQKKPSGGTLKKFIIALVVIIVLSLAGTGVFYYLRYFGPNVSDKQEYLYIHTGSGFDEVYKTIIDQGIVKDTTTFMWAAHNMNYTNRVKPGKYRLTSGMSNRSLINMLKSGNQEPVKLAIHNIRLKSTVCGFSGQKAGAGFGKLAAPAGFCRLCGEIRLYYRERLYHVPPNSYEFYWNTTPEKFFERMYANYQKFWTPERKAKAAAINLTPAAGICFSLHCRCRSLHDDEMPAIAGLYLNRLKKGMKLETDPTVIFAVG